MTRKRPRLNQAPKRKMVGIIAEDDSDVLVISHLIRKISKSPIITRSFAAGGCGKIVGKCASWAENLKNQGCKYLLLFHDLDRRQHNELMASLVSALKGTSISQHLIVIPIREIEAWLLADHEAINKAFKLKRKIAKIANPESIQNPKERLGHLVYTRSGHQRTYVNAIHNEAIAAACSPTNLKRCASFVRFDDFVREHI